MTVHSYEAVQGASDAEIVFRVPNEDDRAKTTKIEIDLPVDTPLLGVVVSPPAGWKATTTTAKLAKPVKTDDGTEDSAVNRIIFARGSISGEEYVDFPITADLLPSTPRLVFKVLQSYSNGKVVRWIEQAAAGGDEPEHPAPVLALAPGPEAGATPSAVTPSTAPASALPSPPSAEPVPAVPSTAPTATVNLAGTATTGQVHVALGVGLAALALAAVAGLAAGAAISRRR